MVFKKMVSTLLVCFLSLSQMAYTATNNKTCTIDSETLESIKGANTPGIAGMALALTATIIEGIVIYAAMGSSKVDDDAQRWIRGLHALMGITATIGFFGAAMVSNTVSHSSTCN